MNAEEQGSRSGLSRFEPVWAGWGAAKTQQLLRPPLQPGGRYSPARITRALGAGHRATADSRQMAQPGHAAGGGWSRLQPQSAPGFPARPAGPQSGGGAGGPGVGFQPEEPVVRQGEGSGGGRAPQGQA